MNLGGPVWHVSIADHGSGARWAILRRTALEELKSVGDKTLGEWEEQRHAVQGRVLHLRRRLSKTEEQITGPVLDVRGTPEALSRLERVISEMPHLRHQLLRELYP